MRRLALLILAVGGVALGAVASADELLMVRSERSFPEAMNQLQQIIQDHGYRIARVQRVDVGLTASGYETAEYRIVFFAKPDEMTALPAQHPELLPYLPLKIVVFAEGESTLALTNNPSILGEFFDDVSLRVQFGRWERDVRSILDALAQ